MTHRETFKNMKEEAEDICCDAKAGSGKTTKKKKVAELKYKIVYDSRQTASAQRRRCVFKKQESGIVSVIAGINGKLRAGERG